ncbi:MAG: hypothetical protein M0P77_09320, partial [Firmicutes bacterium]|nr:hypothetical protein [Bacillota bacterium]
MISNKININLKLILTCSLALIFSCVKAQDNIQSNFQEVSPPSPTVASLMKFEETPINNYTGIPDISIPIYNAETISKDISLNLALSYHPSSIEVEEVAGHLGLGWNLMTGGTISRTVRGYPDEIGASSSTFSNSDYIGIYNNVNPCAYLIDKMNNTNLGIEDHTVMNELLWYAYKKGGIDTQYDLYQFNFMGRTGRFYIKNLNGTLKVIPLYDDSVLDIRFNYNISYNSGKLYDFINFIIYDEKGYEYTFDVKEISSVTNIQLAKYFGPGGIDLFSKTQPNYPSAFHLSKVKDNNGNLILEFVYDELNKNYLEIVSDKTYTKRYLTSNMWLNYIDTQIDNEDEEALAAEYMKIFPEEAIHTTIRQSNTKKVQQINIVNKGRIYFEYVQGRLDTNINNSPDTYKLSNITIKNNLSETIKHFRFTHEYYNNGMHNRMILKSVKEFNFDSTKSNDYNLTYKKYNTTKKDYWGYPKIKWAEKLTDPENCFSGVLESMTLPTGGMIVYDFESNTYSHIGSEPVEDFYENPYNWKYFEEDYITLEKTPGTNEYPFINLFDYVGLTDLSINQDPPPDSEYHFTFIVPCNLSSPEANGTINIYEKVGQNYINQGTLSCQMYANSTFGRINMVLDSNKEYYIKYQCLNAQSSQCASSVYFSYEVKHKKPEHLIVKWLYGGGVRIKEIKYHNQISDLNNINETNLYSKRTIYNYSFLNESKKSSGSLVFGKPVYNYQESGEFLIEVRDSIGAVIDDFTISLTSNTTTTRNNTLYLKTQGTDVGYKNVTVYQIGESLFEVNGKSQYEYISPIDIPEDTNAYSSGPPFFPSRNYDYKRGLLKKESYFNTTNDILSETDYEYYTYIGNEFTDFTGLQIYSNGCKYLFKYPLYGQYLAMVNLPGNTRHCSMPITFITYLDLRESHGWTRLKSKTTNNYFYQGSSQNIVQTIETFDYNATNKKIKEHSVTNSLGEVLKTNYTYDGNPAGRNRIGVIKRIDTKRNDILLESKDISYVNTFTDNAAYLPELISVSKGDNVFESRLRFLKYDEFSNPLEVKQEDGIHVVYLWGYNKSQPIAKIENATYAQVTGALGTSIISEANLGAIDNLRTNPALLDTMITTYTYKPLVGVAIITDPRGYRTSYHYDSFGRLEFIKDMDG